MIYIIESEQYGKIEIDEEKKVVCFHEMNLMYLIGEHNRFYGYNGELWQIEFVNNEVILKVMKWEEIGRATK